MSFDGYHEPDWRALERVADLLANRNHHLNPGDFMYMGADLEPGRTIHLYKHIDTRRYLNLDDSGHAYRYLAAPRQTLDRPGRYQLWPSLDASIDHLQLDWVSISENGRPHSDIQRR